MTKETNKTCIIASGFKLNDEGGFFQIYYSYDKTRCGFVLSEEGEKRLKELGIKFVDGGLAIRFYLMADLNRWLREAPEQTLKAFTLEERVRNLEQTMEKLLFSSL